MKNIHGYFVCLTCFCLLIVSSVFLASCKKFLSIPPPETQVQSSTAFNNPETAIAATVGLYSQMMQTSLAISNGGATLYPALSAGELYNTAGNSEYDQFRSSDISPGAGTALNRLWTFAYRNIYHANAVIHGLEQSSTIADSLKRQMAGEMYLVRALHYFYLVNLFGDVPLVTTMDFATTQNLPRSSSGMVYDKIEADLIRAETQLPQNYPSGEKTRPGKSTATALLARVYLYRQNWAAAEASANAVINSGIYRLESDLNSVFLPSSSEAIWQLSPVSTTINTAEGNSFNPFSATSRPTFALTQLATDAFEPGDNRKTAWVQQRLSGGKTYLYPFKYKVRTGAPPYTEYYTVVRLAELYLIRAEARARQNKTDDALADLNVVRARAGLADATFTTPDELLASIMQERRIELMFEWGHRWFDLKRTGLAGAFMTAINPVTWKATDTLYPIPQYEIDTNPLLVQNPGY